MSMSGGRISVESNGAGWNYGTVPGSGYAPDGSLNSAGHGRRSNLYRSQNSTLFNAFEEEGVPLGQLPEEDESSGDEVNARRGQQAPGRSLLGKKGREDVAGGRHPAYHDMDR